MIELMPTTKRATNESGGVFYTDAGKPPQPPTISAVSGTVTVNTIMTLTGVFTAKRSSQVKYLGGIAANNGIPEPSLVTIGSETHSTANPADQYTHNTSRSSCGTGASLRFRSNTVSSSGPVNSVILFPEPTDEFYVSYNVNIDMRDWISGSGAQIKMGRINAIHGVHGSESTYGITLLRNGTATSVDTYTQNTLYNKLKNGANSLVIEQEFNNWCRVEMWGKLSPSPSLQQGYVKGWGSVLTYRNGLNYEEEFATQGEQLTTYPNTDKNSETLYSHPGWTKFMLPFFIRSWMDVDIYADGVYLNDSPERVELFTGASLRTSPKKFVQEIINRTTTDISFSVKGSFTANEDVYAVVVNSDGSRSIPFKVQTAI